MKVGLLTNCGKVCSILKESLATEVINISTLERRLTTAPNRELKTFAKDPKPVIGMMLNPVENNGWRSEDAKFVLVRNGLKPFIL